MDTLLSFFHDLILFTAGLWVMVFWLVFFVLLSVEMFDRVTGADKKKNEVP